MKKPRVLVGVLVHETHTFLQEPTNQSDFAIAVGAEVLANVTAEPPLAMFLVEASRYGWEIVPAISACARPGGPVDDAFFEYYWLEFESRVRPALTAGLDAIFLILHGAMATFTQDDVEGELLARLRRLPGAATLPIFGVLDLHANLSARMCALSNCLLAHRKNPQTDARFTVARAAGLLHRCLKIGKIPCMSWCRVPVVLAPPGTATQSDPMLSLTVFADKIETADPTVWAYNVTAGFSFADTAESGMVLSAVADTGAIRVCEHLEVGARLAWKLRERGVMKYPSVDAVLNQIGRAPQGPIILVEPADNIGAGAPGDGTGILRALLAHQVESALVAIVDPHAVARLANIAIGGTCRLSIGGRSGKADTDPVDLEVILVSRSDGTFTLEDLGSNLATTSAASYQMGPSATVRHAGVTILLNSCRTPPFDLGQYRSQGIDPRSFGIVGVKAAVAHRRAYDAIATASYLVDTPGPCSSDLRTFPYRRLRRPVFPLDPIDIPKFLFA